MIYFDFEDLNATFFPESFGIFYVFMKHMY